MGKARHKSLFHRIVRALHHDRNRGCRLLGGDSIRVESGDDHVHLKPDQIGRQLWKPLDVSFCEAVLDHDVATECIAPLAEPLLEGLDQMGLGLPMLGRQIADPPHPARLLRLAGERRGEEAHDQHCKERPSLHHSSCVALVAPEPQVEQSADRYDDEAYRSLPDGVWRFIEAPSVQLSVLLGALSAGLPVVHVQLLTRGIEPRHQGRSRGAWVWWVAAVTWDRTGWRRASEGMNAGPPPPHLDAASRRDGAGR